MRTQRTNPVLLEHHPTLIWQLSRERLQGKLEEKETAQVLLSPLAQTTASNSSSRSSSSSSTSGGLCQEPNQTAHCMLACCFCCFLAGTRVAYRVAVGGQPVGHPEICRVCRPVSRPEERPEGPCSTAASVSQPPPFPFQTGE